MNTTAPAAPKSVEPVRADYGIDAPAVIRNLLLGALLSATVAVVTSTAIVHGPALRATAAS